MPHFKMPYFGQKPILYFDENFPKKIIDTLKAERNIKNYFKIYSVYDFSNQNQDDKFQYAFAKKKGFILVSLDRDFINDSKFPIQNMPGIIIVIEGKNSSSGIINCLVPLIRFLSNAPKPKLFFRDGKFQVSPEGCIIRARDARSQKIKTLKLRYGDTLGKVLEYFNWI